MTRILFFVLLLFPFCLFGQEDRSSLLRGYNFFKDIGYSEFQKTSYDAAAFNYESARNRAIDLKDFDLINEIDSLIKEANEADLKELKATIVELNLKNDSLIFTNDELNKTSQILNIEQKVSQERAWMAESNRLALVALNDIEDNKYEQAFKNAFLSKVTYDSLNNTTKLEEIENAFGQAVQ